MRIRHVIICSQIPNDQLTIFSDLRILNTLRFCPITDTSSVVLFPDENSMISGTNDWQKKHWFMCQITRTDLTQSDRQTWDSQASKQIDRHNANRQTDVTQIDSRQTVSKTEMTESKLNWVIVRNYRHLHECTKRNFKVEGGEAMHAFSKRSISVFLYFIFKNQHLYVGEDGECERRSLQNNSTAVRLWWCYKSSHSWITG